VHGEVSRDEIVSGYEYAKGQYVIVDESEREQARTKSDRTINIDTFIPPEAVDPLYFDGRTYYLVPMGPAGQKPYALFYRRWWTSTGRAGASGPGRPRPRGAGSCRRNAAHDVRC